MRAHSRLQTIEQLATISHSGRSVAINMQLPIGGGQRNTCKSVADYRGRWIPNTAPGIDTQMHRLAEEPLRLRTPGAGRAVEAIQARNLTVKVNKGNDPKTAGNCSPKRSGKT